jgi:hypothetical protein
MKTFTIFGVSIVVLLKHSMATGIFFISYCPINIMLGEIQRDDTHIDQINTWG